MTSEPTPEDSRLEALESDLDALEHDAEDAVAEGAWYLSVRVVPIVVVILVLVWFVTRSSRRRHRR